MLRAAPAAGALILGSAAARLQQLEYARLSGQGLHTAAALAIASGAILAPTAAYLGWWAGVSASELVRGVDRRRAAVRGALLLVLIGWGGWTMVSSRARHARIDSLRAEALTLERARALVTNSSREELVALAWNRTCPAEILRLLADSSDWAVRANVAGNPSTPAEIVARLAKDANESVRLYASSHPSLRR